MTTDMNPYLQQDLTDEDYHELKRIHDNALFKAWESGYKAGMRDMNSGNAHTHTVNPHQYHGKDANK